MPFVSNLDITKGRPILILVLLIFMYDNVHCFIIRVVYQYVVLSVEVDASIPLYALHVLHIPLNSSDSI